MNRLQPRIPMLQRWEYVKARHKAETYLLPPWQTRLAPFALGLSLIDPAILFGALV